MPSMQAYLIRRLADGTMRTVQAQTTRGAMRYFVATYGPPIGEDFAVKEREGSSQWEVFRMTKNGFRTMGFM